MKKFNIFCCGVGGQGIVTLGQILKMAAIDADIRVIGTEMRGATQREGSVTATVRYGVPEESDKDASAASERDALYAVRLLSGSADVLIASEPLEGIRFLNYAGPNTTIVINEYPMPLKEHLAGDIHYPTKEEYIETMKQFTPKVYTYNANMKAKELFGTFLQMNIVLLGFTIGCVPNFPISIEIMKKTLEKQWPRAVETNIKALMTGYEAGKKAIS
ncbi:MAG: 2-oxoacid:acceptor oxidoreductase family protein [Candidatus Hodarchaeota archaeon]